MSKKRQVLALLDQTRVGASVKELDARLAAGSQVAGRGNWGELGEVFSGCDEVPGAGKGSEGAV